MTYQRGTDLKHCPDECEWLRDEFSSAKTQEGFAHEMHSLLCVAFADDTCPREQVCGTCGEWKERPNA